MSRSAAAKSDSPVVLFLGDASVVDPLVHALVNERMAASSQSLDFETFRFGERPLSEIEASLRQVGMFSPKRCIWLRGFVEARRKSAGADDDDEGDDEQEDTGGTAELLAIVEGGVPAGTSLVVSAATLDARSKLYKAFAKHADLRDHRVQVEHTGNRRGKLSEQGLRSAIETRLAELGVKQVGAGAVEAIVERSGNAVGETLQEVDRVVLAQSDPSKLSAAGVREHMRDLSLGWVFHLTEAIEKRDLASAEALIARLLAEGEPPLRLTGLLASHIGNLVSARPFVDSLPANWLKMRGTDFLAGPGRGLPDSLKGWPGYFRMKAAANFRPEELHRLHGNVRRLDAALKSSPVPPLLLFSRLLQSACIPGAAAGPGSVER